MDPAHGLRFASKAAPAHCLLSVDCAQAIGARHTTQ
jgi:hypothetical protein